MDTIDTAAADWLAEIVGGVFHIKKHGYSNQDDVFTVNVADKTYYLKITSDLETEHDNMKRLEPYLLVPSVVGFNTINGNDYLLMSEIPGKNLAELVGIWTNEAIVTEFAKAIRILHDIDGNVLFPDKAEPGLVVSHGDMALPNIISTAKGGPGYVDLGKVVLDTPDLDLADAVWSLQRNIGSGYGTLLLEAYGAVAITSKLQEALDFRHSESL